MGYKYRQSGRPGIDIIITTKKGVEIGGLLPGVIIPIGYKFRPDIVAFVRNTENNVYIAKHCEDFNTVTHIQPGGIVNRFGWFITNSDVFSARSNWTLDIGGPGWLRRITIQDIKEIEKYL